VKVVQGRALNQWVVNLGIVLFAMLAVTLLSFFSGFRSFPVPIELAWQFSPIGFLQGIEPSSWDFASVGYFSGKPGLTPDYAIVFLKTCLCEFPLYWLCFRGFRFSSVLAICCAANLATHPFVFFLIPKLFDRYVSAALFSEAFAPSVEMIIAYFVLVRSKTCRTRTEAARRSLWILAANLYSWELGMFI
jgi:hypothetical protein